MNLKDEAGWNDCVKNNKDPYGKCVVDVARRVMELLDEGKDFDPHTLICQADDDISAGGITGYMAGAVANIVSYAHERGEEFRKKWNHDVGDGRQDDAEGVLNPAIVVIKGG